MSSSYSIGKNQPVIVLGLGNVLMRDEAVGVRIVQALENEADSYPDVEFADYGTAGMRILHGIAGRRKAVIVDCAKMDLVPGEIRRFRPAEVSSIKRMPGFSLHEGDILSVLNLSKQLGEIPDDVVIYGIEPEIVEPGDSLSDTLSNRLGSYTEAIRAELAQYRHA